MPSRDVAVPVVGALADTREALSSLGYTADEIRRATQGLSTLGDDGTELDSGALLKLALRTLAEG